MQYYSKMQYYRSKYQMDDSTAIYCTHNGEPYATISVCLVDYGMCPEDENHIYIPTYKFTSEFVRQLKHDIIKTVVREVKIGFGTGIYVELRDDWKKVCAEG